MSSSDKMKGAWSPRTLTGLAIAFTGSAVVLSFVVAEIRERPRRELCANTMEQLGIAMRLYANNDFHELYPPLSPESGRLAVSPDVRQVLQSRIESFDVANEHTKWQEHLKDIGWSRHTVLDNIFSDDDYFYLGYAVADDIDVAIFAKQYRLAMENGVPLTDDIDNIINPDTSQELSQLYRLREGIERGFYIRFGIGPGNPGGGAYARSRLPVLIERIGNYNVPGGHVLYLDGHVEFIEYPGKWPMTEKTVRILNELDALGVSTP